ncbi:MAG TPA: TIGR03435 family protein [Bryobacteraceae bacterium]
MRKNLLALGAFGPSSRLRGRIEALLAHGRVFLPAASPFRAAASAAVLLTLAIGASFAPRWIALAQTPAFEVASIRPHTGPVMAVGMRPSGPNITIEAMSLHNLIGYAYDLQPYQILGGASWVTADRFDIAAKAEGDAPLAPTQIKQMTQALLTDRFGLIFHRDTKEMPVYALALLSKLGG